VQVKFIDRFSLGSSRNKESKEQDTETNLIA